MAKINFNKLGLKKLNETKTITINEQEIEVKQYLPVNDKLGLIGTIINYSHDNNFPNPIKVKLYSAVLIIEAYTNITFTDKQKDEADKTYDLLVENGVVNQILAMIPEDELKYVGDGINDTIQAVYDYQNSVMGILETISHDYSNLNLDASNIQQKLADPNTLQTVKDVLSKLG